MLTRVGVRRVARVLGWEVLQVAAFALLVTAAHAQDPCDSLLRKLIDDIPDGHPAHRINGGLERLAELETTYGKSAIENVDRVMAASPRAATADVYEQLLGLRGRDEAEEIFRAAAGAAFNEQGRRGLTRAAAFGAVDGVEAGTSVSSLMRTKWQTDAGKGATFRGLDALAESGVPGVDRLLKKAGEQAARAHPGGSFEIQASAAIQINPGPWGRLQRVLVDDGGPGSLNKVDTLTDTHAFQMKSKLAAGPEITFGLEGEVKPLDLDLLVSQSRDRGLVPVLAVSNPVSDKLAAACASADIQIEAFDFVR